MQSGSTVKGGSFCNFCWLFGNCKERQHILPFHPGWTIWTQTKRQSTYSPASKKPCAQPSKTKSVDYFFRLQRCSTRGVLHHIHKSIRHHRPELWAAGKWLCLNHSALPHTVLPIKELLSVYHITVWWHAPYSPDLSPCDFFLFPVTETSFEKPLLCWHSGHSDGHDKTALQHSRKCFPGPLQRPPEMLEVVYCCRRKLFWRRSFAPVCKCTVLIFIPFVLELNGHQFLICTENKVDDMKGRNPVRSKIL